MSYGQSYNQYPAYGEQQSNPYANSQGYGQNHYGNQDVEMNPVQHPVDPNSLFNDVQKIKEGIATLRNLRENRLAVAQNALLESNSPREDDTARQALNEIQDEISIGYQKLNEDIARVKKTPGSANVQSQLEVQGRAIRNEFEQFQKSQVSFQKRLKEQVRRRVQLNNSEASPEEIDQTVEAVLAGREQTFQVAGARLKRGHDVRDAVAARSEEIRSIEAKLVEVSNLVTTMAQMIEQQAPAVEQIDQGAENVARDLGNANTQLGQAVESARKARRWKWYALIIVIIIIAIIVAIAVAVTQTK
ncbi:t-SNARE [Aspergillus nidulans var. acristatus]